MEASLKRFTQWCWKNRNLDLRELFRKLSAKLCGYYNLHGIVGNNEGLAKCVDRELRNLFKWLIRRSHRRSYTWEGFSALLKHYRLEKPRIVWF